MLLGAWIGHCGTPKEDYMSMVLCPCILFPRHLLLKKGIDIYMGFSIFIIVMCAPNRNLGSEQSSEATNRNQPVARATRATESTAETTSETFNLPVTIVTPRRGAASRQGEAYERPSPVALVLVC